MVIGIDVREAAKQKSGKSRYTYHLVMSLIKANPAVSFVLYGREKNEDFIGFKNVEFIAISRRGLFWHTAVAREWQLRVKSGKGLGVEGELFVYFAPTSFIVPSLLSKGLKSVVTVHDLIAFKEKTHQKKATFVEKVFAGRALRKAAKILVPSQNTAHDLVTIFTYAKDKVIVAPLGVDKSFFVDAKKNKSRPNGAPQKYILTVGGLEPRKNIGVLVDAFLGLDANNDYKLVIIGGNGWSSQTLQKKIKQHSDRIMHLTSVSGNELSAWYQHASLFVFPSLYEGFGLPPLEAMASGVPVVSSNSSSLPEVCGVSSLFFKPQSVPELREKIMLLLTDDVLRDSLIKAGNEHAQKFTWERCAQVTMKAISGIIPA